MLGVTLVIQVREGVLVAPTLQVLQGGAVVPGSLATSDPWEFQAACVEAFVASWRARDFSPVTIDNDIASWSGR